MPKLEGVVQPVVQWYENVVFMFIYIHVFQVVPMLFLIYKNIFIAHTHANVQISFGGEDRILKRGYYSIKHQSGQKVFL